jgi:uncharacterized protein YutE (UPF0331/DUF86 family)
MNEQIKQLKEQAMEWVPNMADPDTKIRLLNAEKFAELIVQECIDIAQDRANFPGYPPNDVNDIIDEIREHFGVEE